MITSKQKWNDGEWIETSSFNTGSMLIQVNSGDNKKEVQTIYLRKRDVKFLFNRLCEMGYKDNYA